MHLQNCLLHRLLPGGGGSNAPSAACSVCREELRLPLSGRFLWRWFTSRIGDILHVVELCRSVLRDVPGMGRSVGWVAVVVRSVKLVHQPVESCEARTFSWPTLPVSDTRRSCSARICPPHGAASPQDVSVARCLFDRTMVHFAPPFVVETRIICPVETALCPSA